MAVKLVYIKLCKKSVWNTKSNLKESTLTRFFLSDCEDFIFGYVSAMSLYNYNVKQKEHKEVVICKKVN